VRERIRYRHYSYRTEQAYVHWVRRFVRFHGLRHPREMGAAEIEGFLNHLANDRDVAASTHNQALSALLFLYGDVLGIDLPWLGEVDRPKRPRRLPVVLSRTEVRDVLALLDGTSGLLARLLYGTGMRLMEGVRLRVKDLDLARGEILVRQGKGGKDRVTMIPRSLVPSLREQIARARVMWNADRAANVPGVELPHALGAKYPHAGLSWGWFWVFPSPRLSRDPRST
jgi:integron integrase